MTTPPGWYSDGGDRQRWWDGVRWTDYYDEEQAEVDDGHVMSFASEVGGRKVSVDVFLDRIDLVATEHKGGISAGKVTAGLITGGASLIFTGVGKGRYGGGRKSALLETRTIRLEAINEVSSRKSGKGFVVVLAGASENLTMPIQTGSEARNLVDVLNALIARAASSSSQGSTSVTVQVAAPALPIVEASRPPEPADPIAALAQLAHLHRGGALTDDEFAKAKAKLLGI